MRGLVYWLMGDEVGVRIIGSLKWATTTSLGTFRHGTLSSLKFNLAIAEESLFAMKRTLESLSGAVQIQESRYKQICKLCEDQEAQGKSIFHLEQQKDQAAAFLQAAQLKLAREQSRLDLHKAEMLNMQELTETNEVLIAMARTNHRLRVDVDAEQFTNMKNSFQNQTERISSEVAAKLEEVEP